MKKLMPLLAIVALVIMFSCKKNTTVGENERLLFQQNAEDWITQGNATWTFENGELIGSLDTGAGFVMTKDVYDNFSLELEFYPDSTINSGVFVRCKNYELSPFDCHEMNIWDLHPNQDFRTGAIVTKAIPQAIVNTNYKWNTYKIDCKDQEVKVYINDILTAEYIDSAATEGYIGLQAAGNGTIKFRNVVLK